jgi:hypothetical protein
VNYILNYQTKMLPLSSNTNQSMTSLVNLIAEKSASYKE